MRVIRGRARTPEADRDRTRAILEWVGETREQAVRVWRPHRQVAFGRRETNEPGFADAANAARRRGFPPVERNVGGRAVAYTGSTIAFARFEPVDDPRRGMADRYEAVTETIGDALASVGVETTVGEPPDTFCPGDHSLQADGKIVGIAQRVVADAVIVSGIIVVEDHGLIGDVLADVYAALDVPFDPGTVGSVAAAGGDVTDVRSTVETALIDGAPVEVETLREP